MKKLNLRLYDYIFYIFIGICVLVLILSQFSRCAGLQPAFAQDKEVVEEEQISNESVEKDIKQSFNWTHEIKVTATTYHAVEWQTNSNPLLTASGLKIRNAHTAYEHRYIALSQDLVSRSSETLFMYGDMVYVEGCPIAEYNGIWIVADTMNKRFNNMADFLINPDMKGGKWENIIIKRVIPKY